MKLHGLFRYFVFASFVWPEKGYKAWYISQNKMEDGVSDWSSFGLWKFVIKLEGKRNLQLKKLFSMLRISPSLKNPRAHNTTFDVQEISEEDLGNAFLSNLFLPAILGMKFLIWSLRRSSLAKFLLFLSENLPLAEYVLCDIEFCI